MPTGTSSSSPVSAHAENERTAAVPCKSRIVKIGQCQLLSSNEELTFPWISRLTLMVKYLARIQSSSLVIKMHPGEHVGN